MEENKPKKSKALIITIIVIILLIIAGYLIFKNRDVFGVKTSATIAKIFSPLISSNNSKDLNKIDAQAGEDIKKGDNVSVFGTGANKIPIVNKSGSGESVFGSANQDIANGDIGEIITNNGGSNTFWDSFSGFLGGIFNPTTPTIPDNSCENGAINPPECTTIPVSDGTPDLRAGNVTSISTTIKTPINLYSRITNDGGGTTGHSFSSFFTISITGKTNVELNVVIPTLEAKTAYEATVSYSFDLAGVYSIRACADKKSESDVGTVAESKEDNNCGPWITFTVTNSLPQPCSLPKITDTNGQCINISDCKLPKIVIGNRCEENPAICSLPKITNTETGLCIDPSECKPPMVINGGKCENKIIPPNKCLVIEQNPLTFTPEEKARLAILLRKFYLISSTLKTTEDITTIYNEIDQQKNFISQIEDLTRQCYCQVDGIASTGQTGCKNLMTDNPEWVRHGNPWYTKTSDGSFPYTSEDSGYLKNPASPDDANTERILNIW